MATLSSPFRRGRSASSASGNRPLSLDELASEHFGARSLTCTAHGSAAPLRLLAPHLGSLRRYARAISKSQRSADTVVYVALSALIEDTNALLNRVEPRLIMFRTFHDIWLPLQGLIEPVGASLDRALYCLATMESLSVEEIALITRWCMVEIAERFANLKNIRQSSFVMNGVYDEMIPITGT